MGLPHDRAASLASQLAAGPPLTLPSVQGAFRAVERGAVYLTAPRPSLGAARPAPRAWPPGLEQVLPLGRLSFLRADI